jgi:hypothetical protein
MTDNHKKIIKEFFDNSSCYGNPHWVWVYTQIKGFGKIKVLYNKGEFGQIKIGGVGKMLIEELADYKLDILTSWMQDQLDFLNEIKQMPFIKELKNLNEINFDLYDTKTTRLRITFTHFPLEKSAKKQTGLLKATLKSQGYGVGQEFGDIYMVKYHTNYSQMNLFKRILYNFKLGIAHDIVRPNSCFSPILS